MVRCQPFLHFLTFLVRIFTVPLDFLTQAVMGWAAAGGADMSRLAGNSTASRDRNTLFICSSFRTAPTLRAGRVLRHTPFVSSFSHVGDAGTYGHHPLLRGLRDACVGRRGCRREGRVGAGDGTEIRTFAGAPPPSTVALTSAVVCRMFEAAPVVTDAGLNPSAKSLSGIPTFGEASWKR